MTRWQTIARKGEGVSENSQGRAGKEECSADRGPSSNDDDTRAGCEPQCTAARPDTPLDYGGGPGRSKIDKGSQRAFCPAPPNLKSHARPSLRVRATPG